MECEREARCYASRFAFRSDSAGNACMFIIRQTANGRATARATFKQKYYTKNCIFNLIEYLRYLRTPKCIVLGIQV